MTTHKEALEAAWAAYHKTLGGTMDGYPMGNAITAYLSALSGESGEVVERAQAAIAHLGEAGVMSAKDASALLSDLLAALAAAESRATRAEERIAEMEVALEPFVRHAGCFDRSDESDHYSISAVSTLPSSERSKITIGDLRRARAIANKETENV